MNSRIADPLAVAGFPHGPAGREPARGYRGRNVDTRCRRKYLIGWRKVERRAGAGVGQALMRMDVDWNRRINRAPDFAQSAKTGSCLPV